MTDLMQDLKKELDPNLTLEDKLLSLKFWEMINKESEDE